MQLGMSLELLSGSSVWKQCAQDDKRRVRQVVMGKGRLQVLHGLLLDLWVVPFQCIESEIYNECVNITLLWIFRKPLSFHHNIQHLQKEKSENGGCKEMRCSN